MAEIVAKRGSNFTSHEDEIIKREVEYRKKILFASFSNLITKKSKDREWSLIAAAVNKVAIKPRTKEQVKQRWNNVKKNSKAALGEKLTKTYAKKTGGGEAREQLTSEEERMLAIIGRESVLGVTGGFDSSGKL